MKIFEERLLNRDAHASTSRRCPRSPPRDTSFRFPPCTIPPHRAMRLRPDAHITLFHEPLDVRVLGLVPGEVSREEGLSVLGDDRDIASVRALPNGAQSSSDRMRNMAPRVLRGSNIVREQRLADQRVGADLQRNGAISIQELTQRIQQVMQVQRWGRSA